MREREREREREMKGECNETEGKSERETDERLKRLGERGKRRVKMHGRTAEGTVSGRERASPAGNCPTERERERHCVGHSPPFPPL